MATLSRVGQERQSLIGQHAMTYRPSPGFRAAVVLAAHGSSHPGARGALSGFADKARAACGGLDVHLAYTASPRQGNHPLSARDASAPRGRPLAQLLDRLDADLPRALAAQSLHVVAGDEFARTESLLRDFARARRLDLRLGGPLLSDLKDIAPVADAVSGCLPLDLAPDEAAVFMGHGTARAGQDLYLALAERLRELGLPVLLGVLEATAPGDPLGLEALATSMRREGFRRALLMPLLTVSGRHAAADLAGTGPASWRTRLEARGVTCRCDLAGLVERPGFCALWLDRLAKLLAP